MRFVHMDCLNMWRFASANPQSSRLGSKPLENQLGELPKIAQGAIRSQLLWIMISLIMSILGAETMQKIRTISSFE